MDDTKGLIISTLAGAATAGITLFLNLPISACILSTFGIWAGTTLLLSPDKLKKITDREEPYSVKMERLNAQIKHLKQKGNNLNDKMAVRYTEGIIDNLSKIRNTVVNDPSKYESARKVFEYYIPLTVDIVDKYDEIEDKGLTSKESKNYMTNVTEQLKLLNTAYQQVLNNMYEDDILDATANIKVLNDLLKLEGYDHE